MEIYNYISVVQRGKHMDVNTTRAYHFAYEPDRIVKNTKTIKSGFSSMLGGGTREWCYLWFMDHATINVTSPTKGVLGLVSRVHEWTKTKLREFNPDLPSRFVARTKPIDFEVECYKIENPYKVGDVEHYLHVIVLPENVTLQQIEDEDGVVYKPVGLSFYDTTRESSVGMGLNMLLHNFMAEKKLELPVQEA